MYKAHVNEITGAIQTVKEHSEKTAAMCRDYATSEFKEILYAIGLLHDVGKYQESFQKRISGENIRVEHSTCGAIAAREKYGDTFLSQLMSLVIAGHHSGIPDSGSDDNTEFDPTLCGRLKRQFEDYSAYRDELQLPDLNSKAFIELLAADCGNEKNIAIEKFAFLTRYCFSCLTDADSLDTASVCDGVINRSLNGDFTECLNKLNAKLSSYVCDTELQKTRAVLQAQVFSKINTDSEIYLMNMPTGSGKTLCSANFALERAIKTGKKRIIYVIPYNSIIDQTAKVFEDVFGDSIEILRHQSTFSYDDADSGTKDTDDDYRRTAKLASENWDAKLIITTAVQFFESIYANKRRKLRKLHNMADSILIFDEAHLMPLAYMQPCLTAIAFITKYLNSEALFLTATMPDFARLINEYSLKNCKITNLTDDTGCFAAFDKCNYTKLGALSISELLETAAEKPSSLIVVNKRKTAASLYNMCGGKKYHLSTYMTAFDRERVIREISQALTELEHDYPDFNGVPNDRKITVISTSLIEAGVDLDFYTVYRELAGIDNILQTGGRCNREGKRPKAEAYIFELAEQGPKHASDNARRAEPHMFLSDSFRS